MQPERLAAGRTWTEALLLLLPGCTWRCSSAEVACEAAELRLEQILFPVTAPAANFI